MEILEYSYEFTDELDKLCCNDEEHLEERTEHKVYERFLKDGIVTDYSDFTKRFSVDIFWRISVTANVYEKSNL